MSVRDQIQYYLRAADTAESRNDVEAAKTAYRAAIRYMESFAMEAVSEEARKRRIDRVHTYKKRLETLEQGKAMPQLRAKPPASGESSSSVQHSDNEYRIAARELICRTKLTWESLGGLDEIRRDLSVGFALSLAEREESVRVDGFRNIMLYGPPGTGKTAIAAAISNQLEATFFNVKASNLLSKYFGESTKLVDALYAEAKSEADEGLAVVFIDEFDSLCPSRDSSTSGAERRLLSTLLSVLDGLSEKGEDTGVITLAATNLPWALDEAILSRFQKRVFVGYPTSKQRAEILVKTVAARGLTFEKDVSLETLIEQTEWFSGRDIDSLIRHASTAMIHRSNPKLGTIAMEGGQAMRSYRLLTQPINREDVEKSLTMVKVDSEVRKSDLSRFANFS